VVLLFIMVVAVGVLAKVLARMDRVDLVAVQTVLPLQQQMTEHRTLVEVVVEARLYLIMVTVAQVLSSSLTPPMALTV
jgi:hypothetical protein